MTEDRLGPKRRGRALTSGTICMALVASVITMVNPSVARAQTSDATIAIVAFDASPVAPGGLATADVGIGNGGLGSSGVPLQLTLAVPPGVTLESFTSPDDVYGWDCSPLGPDTTCTLVDSGSATPTPLEGEEIVGGELVVAVDPAADVGAGLTVDAHVTAPGDGAPPDLTDAATTIAFPPMPAGQSLALDVSSDLPGIFYPSEGDTVSIGIRNLGPAGLGGPAAPTTITGILPPGASAWSATGSGWSCADGGGTPNCAWEGSEVGAGESLPPLAVDFVAPGGLTAEGEELSWTRTVSATPASGGTNTVVETDQTAIVVAPPSPRSGCWRRA